MEVTKTIIFSICSWVGNYHKAKGCIILSAVKSESRSVLSDSLWSQGIYSPWNPPGRNTGVGSLSLLQGIFPTQGLNPGLSHSRRILYQLSQKGKPWAVTDRIIDVKKPCYFPKAIILNRLVLGIKLFKSNPQFLPCKRILMAPGRWWTTETNKINQKMGKLTEGKSKQRNQNTNLFHF